MSRKRSLKERYLRFLRRIWPAPTLAALLLSLGSCASQPVISASPRAQVIPAATGPTPSIHTRDELRYPWNPQLIPTELHLAPEFRSACAPVVALPPSLELDENEEIVDALQPIASCLTLSPLTHGRLYLFGESEVPGRWELGLAPGSS